VPKLGVVCFMGATHSRWSSLVLDLRSCYVLSDNACEVW
jgi:hypothetical protein